VLPLAQELLQENHLQLEDLTDIKVNVGPGSFTGLRVGVAIANTLGYVLQVPVNGKKVGELVDAHYRE
jgi:tRNA threonylcarbamoyladenosine biosynthesis protein TsaB